MRVFVNKQVKHVNNPLEPFGCISLPLGARYIHLHFQLNETNTQMIFRLTALNIWQWNKVRMAGEK